MDTVFVEDQESVTVPWAHCWGPSTYVHQDQEGSNPLIIVLFWGPSKGCCTMGTLLRSKKMSPYHGYSVEGQTKATVTCAYCWGPRNVAVPWVHCWDPRKCHHTMGTVLKAKQRLLSHVHIAEGQGKLMYHGHNVESQAKVTVTCAQCWGPKNIIVLGAHWWVWSS